MSQKGMDDSETPLKFNPVWHLSPLRSFPPRNQHTGIQQDAGSGGAAATNATSSTTPVRSFTEVQSSEEDLLHILFSPQPEPLQYVTIIQKLRHRSLALGLLLPQQATGTDYPFDNLRAPFQGHDYATCPPFSLRNPTVISGQDIYGPERIYHSNASENLSAPPGQSLDPLEWISQSKDPTNYSNAGENLSRPPGQSLGPLEWIPQAKDPTPTSHYERTPTSNAPTERNPEATKWIPQDKDPTTAPREIVQLASPTTKKPGHRQRRSDADNAQVYPPIAACRPSIISWICRMFRVHTRAVEVQQGGESAEATIHSGEVATDELTDATAKRVVPATRGPHTEPALNGLDPPSGSIDGDLVRDLTDLVKRGPRAYRGQYSDVYKGTCGRELVAIKVIKSLPSDPLHAVRRRMRREVGTASRFNHPNVLAVYGVVEGDWGQFGGIVTLWCPNGDACTYLQSAPLTPLARLLMVCGVVSGLEYIHGLSVVHGDLKPKNILIDAFGNPVICDFGLVSILDAAQSDRAADNTTTVHTGTVRYLAYELVQDPPEPRSRASDIHALGCVAYEFLYLERPYSARTGNRAEFYIFRDIAAGVPPAFRPPSVLPSSITSLWSLFEWCWDKEPYQRPSISAFSSALRSLMESDLQLNLS